MGAGGELAMLYRLLRAMRVMRLRLHIRAAAWSYRKRVATAADSMRDRSSTTFQPSGSRFSV